MNQKENEKMRTGMSSMLGLNRPRTETPAYTSREMQKIQAEDVHSKEAPSVGRRGRPRLGEESRWKKENSYTTTLVLNKERYLRISEIAYEERMSRKDVIDKFLEMGIRAYEKNPGVLK